MKPPLQALKGPGEEASVNAMKAPPQALPGPGEEPLWCILHHRTPNRNTMKPTLQALEGPGELASC